MKPGDLIEWTFCDNGKVVGKSGGLWSTIENRWVPIGGTMCHLLVSIDEKTYSWLNDKGLFHAHVDDDDVSPCPVVAGVVPRVRG